MTQVAASKVATPKMKTLQEKWLKNYMGFSKNSGTPKWIVYNGKPY